MQKRIASTPFDWDAMQLFLAATRARSLTGAARTLRLDQSTASRRLATLEQRLGVRLFDRVPGGLEPTAVARRLTPLAEAAEAQAIDFLRTSAGADEALLGTVRVAVPETLDSEFLVPALPAFYRAYPNVAIELIAGTSLLNLSRLEADLALRFVRPDGGDFVALRVAAMSTSVWGTKALAKKGIAAAPWIGCDELLAQPAEARWMARHVPSAHVRLRCNRIEAMTAAARLGLGLALLPDALAQRAGLVRVPAPPVAPPSPLWLVGHKALLRVPRVRAVWEFLHTTTRRLQGAAERGLR